MSLYRKYRPQNFGNLVGQDHIKETILNELKHGHITHAYLFAGPRGTGKTSTARLIAKALNCVKLDDLEPCDQCEFCTAISEGSLIDVMEIDAASNRGIDDIRDLREKIKFAPTRAKMKVYIIDEVHMLSKDAFNALLKTLEEPPPQVYFILATTEVHKIPETIISRCQRFDFKRIDMKTIMTRLNYIAQLEKIEVEDAAIELIARNVQGGLRDAITLFEQMIVDNKISAEHIKEHLGIAGNEIVETFVRYLTANETEKCLHVISSVHQEGYDLGSFLREILEYLRIMLVDSIEKEQKEETAGILRMVEIFLEARERLRFSPLPQLPLEIAVLKICARIPSQGSTSQKETGSLEDTGLFQKMMEDKKSEKSADKEEKKVAEEIKTSLSERELEMNIVNIKKYWPRVLEHVVPPSLRRSFQEGGIGSFDSGRLTIEYSTRFHLDKVKSVENTAKIETAFEKVFGRKITIACALAEGQERNKKSVILEHKEMSSEKSSGLVPKEDLAQKALEIFGGEMF